ncbi:S1 family peptidase [Nocardia sp. CDC159]|uniref:S1 family peptidase n=1 Tax=Nocardia pulmonis TaxID=2951408 RepID=A0A9X2EAM8_9NOCA|nr:MULTISPECIES: S1 family peptidase [Nocardia]MCM6774856.1 S1 family peptidase [Nocardia pulmonis]MCM6789787.1 S1 family peptidase [Nocardia sp. CDC159]
MATTAFTAGTATAAAPVTLGGGSGIILEQLDDPGKAADCTLTAIGFDTADRLVGLTAGHCGQVGSRLLAEYDPKAGVIGRITAKSEDMDWAIIEFDPAKVVPTRSVAQSVINSVGAGPAVGDNVCKNGRTTGFTCGIVWETHPMWFASHVCADHGDSGSPVLRGDQLIGMVVAGKDFQVGPVTVELPSCQGAGDLIHQPDAATTMQVVLRDIDRQGGPGAGFRLF